MARYCFTSQDPLTMDNKERPPYTPSTHTHTQRTRQSSWVDSLRAALTFFPGVCLESCKGFKFSLEFQRSRCNIFLHAGWTFRLFHDRIILCFCPCVLNLLVGLSSVFSSCCLGSISSGRTEQRMSE